MAKREVFVTFNALRRYLNRAGCVELRQLERVGDDGTRRSYVEIECLMRSGRSCRGHFAYVKGKATGQMQPKPLAVLNQALARCLGSGWTAHIDEDPFG